MLTHDPGEGPRWPPRITTWQSAIPAVPRRAATQHPGAPERVGTARVDARDSAVTVPGAAVTPREDTPHRALSVVGPPLH